MIQRIQSIYMLISAILIGLLFAFPYAEIATNSQFFLFDFRGISSDGVVSESGWAIASFIGLIFALHMVAVFIYRRRIVQIRLMVFSIILLLGLFGLFYFFTYYTFRNADIGFKVPVVFPLVAIVLDYLAIRNIGKDMALLQSADRIR